jgi:hypothetical protein
MSLGQQTAVIDGLDKMGRLALIDCLTAYNFSTVHLGLEGNGYCTWLTQVFRQFDGQLTVNAKLVHG